MAYYVGKELMAYADSACKPLIIEGLVEANAAVIEQGAPMAFNSSTNKWSIYVSGGPNDTDDPKGFMAEEVAISAVDQKLPIIWQGALKKANLGSDYDATCVTDFGTKVEENPEGTVVFLRI